jgi:hypothetical protein
MICIFTTLHSNYYKGLFLAPVFYLYYTEKTKDNRRMDEGSSNCPWL